MELSFEKFVDTEVGLVALVEEIDDNHVVFLAVTVAAADALLDALRVPRQVEIDDEGAELEVDAFSGGLGGDEDFCGVAKGVDDGGAGIDRAGAGHAAGAMVPRGPGFVNFLGVWIVVGAVENNDSSVVAVRFEELFEKGLGAAGLGENDSFLRGRRAHRRHLCEAYFKSFQQGMALGVHADAVCPPDVILELGDFFFELHGIDRLCGGGTFLRGFGIVRSDLGVFRIFKESVQQLGVEVVTGDELVKKIRIIF